MTSTSTVTSPSWWQKPFRLFQTNLREIDATIDVETVTEMIADLGFNAWLVNAGGIAYFYPVAGPQQYPAKTLQNREDGDLIGAAVTAGAAHGITVVGRFDFSRLPEAVLDEHPDWAYVKSDGTLQIEDGLVSLCPTSEYHTTDAPRILADFVARYEVGGVFFNWLNFPEVAYSGLYGGPCHCRRCRAAFEERYPSVVHPKGLQDPGYPAWVEYSRGYIQELANHYRDTITRVRPHLAVFLADAKLDLRFLETNSFLGALESGKWWAHTPSELASLHRNGEPDRPAIVHASTNLGLPYRLIDEEPAQFTRYMAQAVARGGQPGAVVIGPPIAEQFPSLENAKDVLLLHRDHDELYAQAHPNSQVALLRPAVGTALAAMQSQVDFSGYRGFYTSLQETHVPFDVFPADGLSGPAGDALMDRICTLVIPDGVDVPPRDRLVIDEWVAAGGHLLLAGDPTDEEGAARFESQPARSIRDALSGEELRGRYIGESTPSVRWPALGTFYQVNAMLDSDSGDRWLSGRAPFGPPEVAHGPGIQPEWPAKLLRSHGDGYVTQFPWAIGLTTWRSGLTSLSHYIAANVRSRETLVVSGEFPAQVEIIQAAVDDGLLIHLINHGEARPDRNRTPAPVTGTVLLRLAGVGETLQVRSLATGGYPALTTDPDGTVRITVASLELLEVLHVRVG